jgi:predicted nucleic acid-binding protein
MTVPKIYLETTMFNFPFVEDSPQYRADTLRLFDMIKAGKYEPYTSPYTYRELEATKVESRRFEMLKLIPDYGVKIIEDTPDVERLAGLYLAGEAVPLGFYTDALHIAITTVYGLDFIVSLNFQHIVREKTIRIIGEINAREGYRAIGIYKPSEVLSL